MKEAIDKVLGKSPVKASQKRPPKLAPKPKKLDLVAEEEGEPSSQKVPNEKPDEDRKGSRKVPNKRKQPGGELNSEKPAVKKKKAEVPNDAVVAVTEVSNDDAVADVNVDDDDDFRETGPVADDVEPEISKSASDKGWPQLANQLVLAVVLVWW